MREEGVADARRLLAKYEEKVRYGLSEESDLLQAKASLEIQETELLLARSRVELARHALLFAMGRPGTDALPSPDSAESPRPAVFDALCEEEAVSGRPEAAEAAARRRERSEWDLRFPRLDPLPHLSRARPTASPVWTPLPPRPGATSAAGAIPRPRSARGSACPSASSGSV